MKILFDNNAFAYLSQRLENRSLITFLNKLTTSSKIEIIGSCTLLQELSGLSHSNYQLYQATLADYRQLTVGRILRPHNDILIDEGEQLKPVTFEKSLLNAEQVRNLFDNLLDPINAKDIFEEVGSIKTKYSVNMEDATADILNLPELRTATASDISKGYKHWFESFPAELQTYFSKLFNINIEYNVNSLPHVSMFLGYALTRIYERFTFGKKNTGNDLLDRAHFTDASVVDIIVTNDNAFINTSLRVPNRTFDILRLDEFEIFVNRL